MLYLKPSRTSEARIELIGDVTQDAIEKIKQLLDLQKDSFPERTEQPAVEQPAEQPAIESPETE